MRRLPLWACLFYALVLALLAACAIICFVFVGVVRGEKPDRHKRVVLREMQASSHFRVDDGTPINFNRTGRGRDRRSGAVWHPTSARVGAPSVLEGGETLS